MNRTSPPPAPPARDLLSELYNEAPEHDFKPVCSPRDPNLAAPENTTPNPLHSPSATQRKLVPRTQQQQPQPQPRRQQQQHQHQPDRGGVESSPWCFCCGVEEEVSSSPPTAVSSPFRSDEIRPEIASPTGGHGDRLTAEPRGMAESVTHEMKRLFGLHVQDNWLADEHFELCADCGVAFSWKLRRHHCRVCGQVFCHECTSKTVAGNALPGNRFQTRAPQRSCNKCCDDLIKQAHICQPSTVAASNTSRLQTFKTSYRSKRMTNVIWENPMSQADMDPTLLKSTSGTSTPGHSTRSRTSSMAVHEHPVTPSSNGERDSLGTCADNMLSQPLDLSGHASVKQTEHRPHADLMFDNPGPEGILLCQESPARRFGVEALVEAHVDSMLSEARDSGAIPAQDEASNVLQHLSLIHI
eukprot:TRINITY_DN9447_c0_g1_i2.p1 TRINITY_DN9447_c0_g1~~TRINITY_DN9447_c0_g1_i2.p1  ORF type:complete len:413 (-),score=48.80 TRINITY_DN9447_c0_g1_i2:143-1381(-)